MSDIVLKTKKGREISFCSLCVQDKTMCEECKNTYIEGSTPHSFIPLTEYKKEIEMLKESLDYKNGIDSKLSYINSVLDLHNKSTADEKKEVPLKELSYTPLNFFIHSSRKVCCISNEPYIYYGENNTIKDKLKIGEFYTIKKIFNYTWMSMIEFEEIPNDMFNSLHFRELEEEETE